MTYYPDLSPYVYYHAESGTLNIGWLDVAHDYTQGVVSDEFIERLWKFCQSPIHHAKGFHKCDFCDETVAGFGTIEQYGDEQHILGSAEFRVAGEDGTTYIAPDLIYHYVVAHHYKLPKVFIQAVINVIKLT
jgi:hypothetical protein